MEPKYKVGDIVTIKKREGDENDYNFTFVDGMAKLAGQKFKVVRISPVESRRKIPDDGFKYNLNDPAEYNWASSMFEDPMEHLVKKSTMNAPLSTLEDKDGDISPFIKRKSYPKLDFNL